MFFILLATVCLGTGFFESLGSGYGPETVKQISGYFNTDAKNGNDGHLFFWLFESRGDPKTDPLVMWLTGGPGCSSELAIFYEMGPYRIDNETSEISLNPYAWNGHATMLYMDQPVGTGYSYADDNAAYCSDEDCVAQDLYEFLEHFFDEYPQYANLPFFVTGESYGGHYVPAISHKIYQENKASSGGFHINMKGFAVGNGLTMPSIQYGQYNQYSYDNKLISESQYNGLKGTTKRCVNMIDAGNTGTIATIVCNQIVSTIQKDGGNFNVYDIRKPCVGSLCYDFSPMDNLMVKDDVKKALGVSDKANWAECDMDVHQKMMGDWFFNLRPYIPPMLDDGGYRVLIYAGKEDFICNWYGNRDWVESMEWSGGDAYRAKDFVDWTVNGKLAGTFKTQGNLTFMGIEEAGHMVPMDQPENALEMFKGFIRQ